MTQEKYTKNPQVEPFLRKYLLDSLCLSSFFLSAPVVHEIRVAFQFFTTIIALFLDCRF
jgi:hypothetical protein